MRALLACVLLQCHAALAGAATEAPIGSGTAPPPPTLALRLASALSDDAVLAAAGAVVWGWAKPGAAVAVAFSGAHTGRYSATAAASDGAWRVDLPTVVPSLAPSTVTISSVGEPTRSLRRVLFGQLILCGGQSNMQASAARAAHPPAPDDV